MVTLETLKKIWTNLGKRIVVGALSLNPVKATFVVMQL